MPRLKVETPGFDSLEQEFLDALARLQDNKPNDKKLALQAKKGVLRISVSTVAAEAGRSRTLIGHAKCKYPRVRDKILALRGEKDAPTRLQDIVANKREETAQLKRELHNFAGYCTALIIRAVQVEEKREALERQVKRMQQQKQHSPVLAISTTTPSRS